MEQTAVFSSRRILVIEDDYLVAQLLTQMLEDAGAVTIGPVGQIDEALSLIQYNGSIFDNVVLDTNLHGQASYPVADALIAREVRFMFTTGYDANAINEAYRGYPHCGKPFQEQVLLAAVVRLLE